MKKIFLIYLFVSSILVFAEDTSPCQKLLQTFSNRDSISRRYLDSEFWKLYKNDDTFAAWVNQEQSLRNSKIALRKWHKLDLKSKATFLYIPKMIDFTAKGSFSYQQAVLRLRKGDLAVFSNGTFRIGKFLGAGNATHIYELLDDPNHVIRIPYLADEFISAWPITDEVRLIESRRQMEEFVRLYPEVKARKVKMVELIKTSESFEYAVVTKVHGKITGVEVILSNRSNAGKYDLEIQERLFQSLKNIHGFATENQFLLENRDWVLVDWEDLRPYIQ